MRRDIALAIRRARPELLITLNHHASWGGDSFNMADHRNVGLAVLDASRDAGNRWVFPEAGLEPWGGVRTWRSAARRTRRTRSMSARISNVASHRSSVTPRTSRTSAGTRVSMLTGFARAAGEAFGCEYAVSFELLES